MINKKISLYTCNTLYICCLLIVSFLFLASLLVTYTFPTTWDEIPYRKSLNGVGLSIAGFFIFFCLSQELLKRLNFSASRRTRICCFFITIVIATSWCLIANVGPYADQYTMQQLVILKLQGIVPNADSFTYIDHYPYQAGYFIYMYMIASLFGENNYLAYRFFNILCVALIVCLISRMAEIITKNEKVGSVSAILLTTFLPFSFTSTLIYGNIPSLLFSLISCEQAILIVKQRNKRFATRTGIMCVSLFIALWFKPNAMIFLIAIGLWLLIGSLKNKKLVYLIPIGLLFVVYYLNGVILNYSALFFIGDIPLRGTPLCAWLAMGLQESEKAPGWYNNYVWMVWIENSGDAASITAASAQSITESLSRFFSDPWGAIRFFGKKILTQWSEPTFQSLWNTFGASQEGKNSVFYNFYNYDSRLQMSFMYGKARTLYELYCDSLQTFVYLSAVLGLICQLKRKNFSSTLLIISFLGGFLYFFLFEAKSMYVLPYFLLLFPFSAIGLIETSNYLKIKHLAKNR